MAKKVIDIIPLKKRFEDKKKEIKKLEIKAKEPALEIEAKKLQLKLPEFRFFKFSLKFLLSFLAILFLLSIVLLSFKFSKAETKIWPKTEELKLSEKLVVDTKIDKVDVKNRVIPGKIFESEEIFSEEFSSTGKILKKAQGTIRLFNEYKTEDEIWLAGTRFVSSDGKLFKSKDKILVPGAKIEGGKIKASYVDVPVEAAEGGADYNIGPSDFSIVAFKGTPRYFKYYGKSFEPMKGGGEFPKVQKEDLENAEKSLIELAKNKAIEIFKNKIPAGFEIPEKAFSVEVLEKNSTAKEGEEVEKFNFQVKLKIKSIAFSKEDLSNFAKEYTLLNLPNQKEIYFPSLKLDPKTEILNFELGKVTVSLDISIKTYSLIDEVYLKKGLAGKNLSEAKTFLLNQPEFSKVQINIFPFWSKRIPENINQIEIFYPLID